MWEHFNKEVKQGRRFAADAARITDECAGREGCKRSSDGSCVAINCDREQSLTKRKEPSGLSRAATKEQSPKHW